MNKDLEMQVKQVQKECNAKLQMMEDAREEPNDDCSLSTTKSFITPVD